MLIDVTVVTGRFVSSGGYVSSRACMSVYLYKVYP